MLSNNIEKLTHQKSVDDTRNQIDLDDPDTVLKSSVASKIGDINGDGKFDAEDIKIFKEGGLRAKMRALPGKKGIADRGYEGESALLAMPTTIDKHHIHTFKSRARCRMENFNARIKQYHSMNTYWEHGKAKHKIAFEAVCVTCQYRMENGHPLWDV